MARTCPGGGVAANLALTRYTGWAIGMSGELLPRAGSAFMGNNRTFTAFLSYAHQDAEADPLFLRALTEELEKRVQVRLVNDSFAIWRDTTGLRTGDRWEPTLETVLRNSDILIVLLTPKWIGSDHCTKEYNIFEQVEVERSVEGYIPSFVAPILFRDLTKSKTSFTSDQRNVFDRLNQRQYRRAFATDFLKLGDADRLSLIDQIADDLEGMIMRRRVDAPHASPETPLTWRPYRRTEFEARSYNYEEVDFVSSADVVFDTRPEQAPAVYAQVDFVERLHLQSPQGTIVFGVRQAFLSIQANHEDAVLTKDQHLQLAGSKLNVSYKTRQDAPDAVSICIEPLPGKVSLGELVLPPSNGENYLSKIAEAKATTTLDNLNAELIVSMNAEGLYFPGNNDNIPSERVLSKIKAIMSVALSKIESRRHEFLGRDGQLRRKIVVRERT